MADAGAERGAAATAVVVGLCNAVSARSLYPADHPLAREPVEQLAGSLRAYFSFLSSAELTLLLVDGELVVEGRALRSGGPQERALRRALERAGVERLSLRTGLGWEELAAVVDALAGRAELRAGEHVVLGRVRFEASGGGEGGQGETPAESEIWEEFEEGGFAALEEGAAAFHPGDAQSLAALDRGIWHMLEGIARSRRRFVLLAHLRRRSQALHRHATSVCLHAAALARYVGVEGQPLHDIALGALLHDSGLLELPAKVLRSAARGEAWARDAARRHPELGAARLAAAGEMPELAVLIAYEHHVFWDGRGGYPRIGRRPGLGAQITAVADAWDLLLHAPGSGPGGGRRTPPEIGPGLAHRAASLDALREIPDLNPRLVEAFVALMTTEA